MRNSVFRMVSSQWTRLPPPLQADLAGKTVVIVGANTGIGLEAAKHFARLKPARLIIGCRSEGRGRAAVEKIAKATGYAAEIQLIDLSNFASVQAFAARLQDTPVDILIANAAIGQPNFVTTKDGWEETLQVNHLSTALLCLLLLPNLARAAREHNSYSRLVVTSSGMHMTVNLDKHAAAPNVLRALNTPEDFTGKDFPQYSETKLLNVFFVRALAEHLRASAIVPAACCPGFCVSELRRHVPWRRQAAFKLLELTLGRTAEQGARQVVHAALGPDGKDGAHVAFLRGAYVATSAVAEPSDYVISKQGWEMQERLWRETIEVLAEVSPDVRRIVKEMCQ